MRLAADVEGSTRVRQDPLLHEIGDGGCSLQPGAIKAGETTVAVLTGTGLKAATTVADLVQ